MKENHIRYKLNVRILSVLLILLLLTSCKVKENKVEIGGIDTSANETMKQGTIDLKKTANIAPSIKGNFEILFFEDNTIILGAEKYTGKQVDCADLLLYRYDLTNEELKYIGRIKSFYLSFGTVELMDGKLYYPYSRLEDNLTSNFIMQIDINTLEYEEVSYGKEEEIAVRLASTSNLILKQYQIARSSEETDYYIDVIKDGKKRNIIEENYASGNGELLIDTFGEKDKIYIYGIDSKDYKSSYVINQYDLNGNLENKIELDLDSFLDLPEMDDHDSVFSIFKVNDYFILNTLNSRNRILKQEGSNLVTIEIPEKLEKFAEGANIIANCEKEDSLIYFEGVGDRGVVIIFDTNNGKFSEILINSDDAISNIKRDSTGNLIVSTRGENKEDKSYFVKRSILLKTIGKK